MPCKSAILVVVSFLVVALIFSSFSRSDVFALSKLFTVPRQCTSTDIVPNPTFHTQRCCYSEWNEDEQGNVTNFKEYCQDCYLGGGHNWICGDYYETSHRPPSGLQAPKPAGNALPPPPQPPKNAPPPSTQQTTCPDGSAPDANGKCPTTTNQQVAPSQKLVGPASDNNNPQPEHQHHKGQESTKKGNK